VDLESVFLTVRLSPVILSIKINSADFSEGMSSPHVFVEAGVLTNIRWLRRGGVP
jgi:hypothetical protein